VRLRLRADVPLALSLSGGVDSSVVAAELAHQGAAPEAFTVVFQGDSADLPYARHVATQLGLRHSIIPAGAGALAREVASAAEHYDEPFADSSAIACLALARAVAGRYKVILDGDGGDEAFGGYRHYEYIGAKQALKAAAAAVGLRDGAASATVYEQSKVLFSASRRAALLNGHGGAPAALDRLLATDAFLRAPQPSALKRALWSDRHLALANGLTYKMDIALSAHGVEGRAPLLDHRVLEWAQNLDDRDLVRGREKKVLLREAYAGRLPRTVLDRPKHGFGAPVAQWLAGPLRDYVADLLPCPLLDPVAQRQLSGQRQWAVFALAVWAKRWRPTW
jgi:asparagine synthase (glutamine-hydrolysing)